MNHAQDARATIKLTPLLTGAIVERQWDENWNEWKYLVAGEALDGRSIEIVAKLGHRDDTLIITVYRMFEL